MNTQSTLSSEAPILATTEVISPLRQQAYQEVAASMGGTIVVREVAGPGDVLTVDTFALKAPIISDRGTNRRDRGTLLGVNLTEQPEVGPHADLEEIPLREGQKAVVVERPATYDPRTGRRTSDFDMPAFYEATTEAYKRLRRERRSTA